MEHHKGSRIEYMVKVKAQFKRRSTANNVEIFVPVPDDADTPKFRVRPSIRLTMLELRAHLNMYIGINRQCTVRARQVRVCVEDHAAGRRPRVPHARALWSAECPRWCVSVSLPSPTPSLAASFSRA